MHLSPSVMMNAVSENPTSRISDAVYRTLYARSSEFRKAAAGTSIKTLTIEDACKGRGYLSSVLKATVEFSNERSKPFTFIMKIPDQTTVDTLLSTSSNIPYELATSIVVQVMNGHNTECEFYDVFSGCASVPLPSVYSTQRSSQGYKTGGILMEHVNGVPQNRLVKTCIRVLAKFHACALSYRSRWSRRFSKSSLFVGPYAEMPRQMLPQLLQFDRKLRPLSVMCNGERFSLDSCRHREAEERIWQLFCAVRTHRRSGRARTTARTLSWRLLDEQHSLEAHRRRSAERFAVCDHRLAVPVRRYRRLYVGPTFTQTLSGNPMFDLARLFVTSMDAERRWTVEGWAIQYCYDTMRHLRCANFDLPKAKNHLNVVRTPH
ncbi:hypothetical protein AAVH_28598 [Aphelenchoides avenae]|nr:hypothetical protein AAVH_28598 [Aphelenchus avenae]